MYQFTITWPRIPTIGTRDAFINSYVKSKFQLSGFHRLRVVSKFILICQNLLTKTVVKYTLSPIKARAKYQLRTFYWKQRKIFSNKIASLELISIDQFKLHTTAAQAKYRCTNSAKLPTKLISRRRKLLESWNFQNIRIGKNIYL